MDERAQVQLADQSPEVPFTLADPNRWTDYVCKLCEARAAVYPGFRPEESDCTGIPLPGNETARMECWLAGDFIRSDLVQNLNDYFRWEINRQFGGH